MEVFVMSMKLQTKDLINWSVHRSLLCDWFICVAAIPIGFVTIFLQSSVPCGL